MEFKKGDKVVCVAPPLNDDVNFLLSYNQVYEVEYNTTPTTIKLVGLNRSYVKRRFEISKESQFDKLYLRLKG